MSADRRQEFLSALAGGAAPEPSTPAEPEQSAPAVTEQEPPAAGASPAAPLTFEEQPPAAVEVPAALAALAEPAAVPPAAAVSGDLMDLGHDAQMQGTALGLHSIGQRLAIISEGLKLVPILAGVARDLEHLNYGEVAQAIDSLIRWVNDEEKALYEGMEARAAARRGETAAPPDPAA